MTEYIFREVHYGYTDGTALGRTLEKQEEIVRCCDCNFFATNIHGSYCTESITTLSDSNGFCAWGERRTDDN